VAGQFDRCSGEFTSPTWRHKAASTGNLPTTNLPPRLAQYGITVILMRFRFDRRKSKKLRANPRRGIGFEEAQEIFSHPFYLDSRSHLPEQYRAIGWVGGRLYSVIFEVREDAQGEYWRLVTRWKATRQEQQLYEENS